MNYKSQSQLCIILISKWIYGFSTKVILNYKTQHTMKKFEKVVLEAKNNPTGSYAAGCPTYKPGGSKLNCENCAINA